MYYSLVVLPLGICYSFQVYRVRRGSWLEARHHLPRTSLAWFKPAVSSIRSDGNGNSLGADTTVQWGRACGLPFAQLQISFPTLYYLQMNANGAGFYLHQW
ncbi:hypothetical protein F5Y04DRAFT_245791 [Hypomontagnella monticulosa]|nr:hypothetical protein F5Y04DRAFT_245791 [Hypomontagnella monticulosa]